MSWNGVWAYRIPLKYGSTKPSSLLNSYYKNFNLASHPRLSAEQAAAGGSRPSMAVTLADGVTTVPFGVLGFNTGGDLTNLAAGTFDATTDTITITAHGLQNGYQVQWSANAPGGISTAQVYTVRNKTANTFQVSATYSGSIVNITTTGSFGAGDAAVENTNLIFRAKFDVSSSASTGDILGYLYVDHAQTDTENKSGVLDSNTKGYWPLDDIPTGSAGDIVDWSGNYNGTSSNCSSAAGLVSNGLSFNGDSTAAGTSGIITTYAGTPTDFTCSAWFNCNVTAGGYGRVVGKGYDTGFWIGHSGSGSATDWGSGVQQVTSPYGDFATASNGSWHHIASVRSGTTHIVYIDGVAVVTATRSGSALSNIALAIGRESPSTVASSDRFGGTIDEVRMAETARSAAWIAYEYADEANNANTTTFGTEEAFTPTSVVFVETYSTPRFNARRRRRPEEPFPFAPVVAVQQTVWSPDSDTPRLAAKVRRRLDDAALPSPLAVQVLPPLTFLADDTAPRRRPPKRAADADYQPLDATVGISFPAWQDATAPQTRRRPAGKDRGDTLLAPLYVQLLPPLNFVPASDAPPRRAPRGTRIDNDLPLDLTPLVAFAGWHAEQRPIPRRAPAGRAAADSQLVASITAPSVPLTTGWESSDPPATRKRPRPYAEDSQVIVAIAAPSVPLTTGWESADTLPRIQRRTRRDAAVELPSVILVTPAGWESCDAPAHFPRHARNLADSSLIVSVAAPTAPIVVFDDAPWLTRRKRRLAELSCTTIDVFPVTTSGGGASVVEIVGSLTVEPRYAATLFIEPRYVGAIEAAPRYSGTLRVN